MYIFLKNLILQNCALEIVGLMGKIAMGSTKLMQFYYQLSKTLSSTLRGSWYHSQGAQ